MIRTMRLAGHCPGILVIGVAKRCRGMASDRSERSIPFCRDHKLRSRSKSQQWTRRPFHDDEGREQMTFPWDKLTGAPLIYASMGTTAERYGARVPYDHCGSGDRSGHSACSFGGQQYDTDDLGPIPPNTIVARTAPQLELLKTRGTLYHACRTEYSAGGTGTWGAYVAIPIGFDQPGVAARIAYHGGEFVEAGI